MAQPLRIENKHHASLITTRTRNSELWFSNNRPLEGKALGYLAKYGEHYRVRLYAFVFQGNHHHIIAQFPELNRAAFMRDFNSIVARLCTRHVLAYPGGKLWARRYSEQALPNAEDIEEYFFYCALQPVLAGLCEHPKDYPGYNSFYDAICGRKRKFKVIDWNGYRQRKRFDPQANVRDFTKTYLLEFARLPGYEQLSQEEYKRLMLEKLETRIQKAVAERRKAGLGFLGRTALTKVKPGRAPRATKTSERHSFRPLVLTKCKETKRQFLAWYFSIREAFLYASRKFRTGSLTVAFPPGTYRPPSYVLAG